MQHKLHPKHPTLLWPVITAVVALFVFGVVGLSQLMGVGEAEAEQSVPYRINYQGRISDNQGSIMPDGNYNVTFRLFDSATGGTPIWTETRTGGNRVQVTNGLFNLQLGEVEPLPEGIFSTYPLYLEVELPTPGTVTTTSPSWTEGPFDPRQRLASAPYAFNADQLDGLSSEDFVQLSPGSQQTGSINVDGSIQGSSLSVSGQIQGGSLNISGSGAFTGRVSGADALEQDEFTTLSQLEGIDVSSSAFLQGGNDFGGMATLGTTTADNLRFITSDTERMRILANGDIGIGVVGPSYRLDVGGDINTSGVYRVNGTQISTSNLSDGNNITLQGNTFNGANQLVQLNASGQLPALDGSLLTDLDADNITSGTLADARLSNNVTLQGNTFNGANQLVQLNASGTFDGSLITDTTVTNAKLANDSLTVTAGTGLSDGGSVALGGSTTINIDTSYFDTNYYNQADADDEFVSRTGDSMLGNLDMGGYDLTDIGNLGIGTATPSHLLHVSGTGVVARFDGRVSGVDAIEDDEFITKGQLDSALDGVATSDGLFTEDSSGTPTFTYLDNTASDLVLGANNIADASFYFNTATSNLFLGTDGVSDGILTLYSSGAGISPATISVNDSGDLNLSSGSGKVVVGGGSGDIELALTGEDDHLIADKEAEVSASYSGSDFQFNRNLSNTTDTHSMGGSVLSVTDSSTLQSGTIANYDLIFGNANPSGASFSGNLLRLQADGTDRFIVTADGDVIATSFQGSGADLTNLNADNIASGTLSVNRLGNNSITNAKLVNDSLTVTAGTGLTGGGSIALGGSTTIDLDSSYLGSNYFAQGGNDFGVTATLGTTDEQDLRFMTNNSEAMRIDSSGNVGIGTTTPDYRLHLSTEGNSYISQDAYGGATVFQGRRAGGTEASPEAVTQSQLLTQLGAAGHDGNSFTGTRAAITLNASENWDENNQGSSISFFTTNEGSTALTEQMKLRNGNLGIGTGNPQEALHVNGNSLLSGDLTIPGQYEIGDIGPGGGYIFLADGGTVYEVATDYSATDWGCYGTEIGNTGVFTGDGADNTATILAECNEPGIAAEFADQYENNGYTDWFLPSANELESIYENLHLGGLGNFTGTFYWTSSEHTDNRARGMNFDTGNHVTAAKTTNWRAYPVRTFDSTTTRPILRVDSTTGNIGLGIGTPSRTLDVLGQARIRGTDPAMTTQTIQGAEGQFTSIFNVLNSSGGSLLTVSEEGDGADWSEITSSADWADRNSHASTVFDGKMWVVGGGPTGSHKDDVWHSEDGVNWTQATSSAAWSARRGHRVEVFNNKMWVIGGAISGNTSINDVWSSSDGVNWSLETDSPGWGVRKFHGTLVYDNKLWVFGGSNSSNTRLNDVWYSSDGVNWTEATSSADWSNRFALGVTVFDDKMWVMGGSTSGGFASDVWHSEDGINWTQATSSAAWSGRFAHGTITAYDRMWVLGGHDGSNRNDVYSSVDGETWLQETSSAPWSGRNAHTSLVYDGSIWVLGGEDNSGQFGTSAPRSDVWRSGETGEVRIGVGVAAPNHAMDVAGDVNITGTYRINGNQISTSNLSDGGDITLQGNTFNGANQLVQLNASGQLPALDGSLLTDLDATALTSGTLDMARIADGSVTNAKLDNSSLVVTAGTGLIGGGSVSLGGTTEINIDDSYLDDNYFAQGGNGFGETAVMGTTDNQALSILTNNAESMRILANGNVGIGVSNPQETLDVAGGIRLGNSTNTNAGTIRWTGTDFEGYDGSSWLSLTDTGSGGGGLTGNGNDGELAVFDSSGNLEGFSSLAFNSGTGRLSVGSLTSAADIVVGGSSNTTAGAIRFNGTDFEGYDGSSWNTFTGGGSSAGVSSLRGLDGSLNLQGTANQITVSDNGTDTITLSLPQDINTTSNVTFANLSVADLTASGTVTFASYDCSTYANGGKLTTNASGTLICADDIAGAGGSPGTQTQRLIPEFAGGTLSADGTDNNGVMTADHISGLSSGQGHKHNFYEWSTSQSSAQNYDVVINHALPNNFNASNGFAGSSWSVWTYVDSMADGDLEFSIESAGGTTCINAESVAPSATATWQQITLSGDPETACSFDANDVITIKIKMISSEPSSNKVRLGEIQYQYTP